MSISLYTGSTFGAHLRSKGICWFTSEFWEIISRTPHPIAPVLLWVFVFRSALGLGFQGVQGHVGVSYATQSLQVVAMAGFALTPLSVSSSLFPISRVPFVEIGVRNSLNSSLSFIGTYGYQHGDLSVHSIRTGLQWEKSLRFVHLSVYGGRHFFHSSVGFPGYEMVGARKVSFSQSAWETHFSLSFSL